MSAVPVYEHNGVQMGFIARAIARLKETGRLEHEVATGRQRTGGDLSWATLPKRFPKKVFRYIQDDRDSGIKDFDRLDWQIERMNEGRRRIHPATRKGIAAHAQNQRNQKKQ